MKDLIIQALNETSLKVEKQIPLTKTHTVEVNITDVSPLNLLHFMKDNNIPDTAYFDTDAREDTGWTVSPTLCYEKQIPTTQKDQSDFRKKRFNFAVFKFVYDLLIANGYKRVGVSSNLFKEFQNDKDGVFNIVSVYKMYQNKEFDQLVKYYSLYFTLEK